MKNPKILVGVGVITLGLVIGALIGLQGIKSSPVTTAQLNENQFCDSCLEPNTSQVLPDTSLEGEEAIDIKIIPHNIFYSSEERQQVINTEAANYEAKGKQVQIKEMVLAGEELTFIIPAGTEGDFEKRKQEVETQLVTRKIEQEKREREYGRTADEKALEMNNIKDMFDDVGTLVYKEVRPDRTAVYEDNRGYRYSVDFKSHKVTHRGIGSNQSIGLFHEAHKDLTDENLNWITSPRISSEQAEQIAKDFVQQNVGDPEEIAKEYGYAVGEGKGETYLFTWGDKILLVLIPVNGEILHFSTGL